MPDDALVVAVPKGRILGVLSPLFHRAGIDGDVLTQSDRRLVRSDHQQGLSFLMLKPDDVPTYVEYGAADLGIVGRDVLLERDYDLFAPVDLGVGICRMMVAGLPLLDDSLDSRQSGAPTDQRVLARRAGALGGISRVTKTVPGTRPLRVATKYPSIASTHFARTGRVVETIYVQGSVELAPITGLADLIVDLVETGETLRANGLIELEEVCEVSSVVVVNRASLKLHHDRIRPLLGRLRQAVGPR